VSEWCFCVVSADCSDRLCLSSVPMVAAQREMREVRCDMSDVACLMWHVRCREVLTVI
jgi:hypothetical protein